MGIVAKNTDLVLLEQVRELADYLGENPLVTAINIGNSFYLVAESWEKKGPKTSREIHTYYRESREYLYNLVISNYAIPTQVRVREDVDALVRRGMTVLDVGGGIGSTLLGLRGRGCSALTHADVGGVMLDFARWRYARAGMLVELLELPPDYLDAAYDPLAQDPLAESVYDVVVCTEVIEHVTEPEKLVRYLARHVKPGGKLVATVSFDDDHGLFPCHLNRDKWTNGRFIDEVFPGYGFKRLDEREHVFIKE